MRFYKCQTNDIYTCKYYDRNYFQLIYVIDVSTYYSHYHHGLYLLDGWALDGWALITTTRAPKIVCLFVFP